MTIDTWEQLFEQVGGSAISNASDGKITKQLAQYWKEHGLPTNEHTGLANRSKYIVQAAKGLGFELTRTRVLRLSNEFKLKKIIDKREGKENV